MRRRPLLQRTLAAGLAIAVNLLALLALGWRTPVLQQIPPPGEAPPAIQLSLVRIKPERALASAPAKAPPKAVRASAPSQPSPTLAPAAPPASPAQPSSSAVASGAPDCEVEDLPLLTEAERGRCRDQIAADKARRAAQGADARIAKQVAEAKAAPRMYRMAPEKRAYYDAVAQAYDQQSHGPPMAGHNPGFACGHAPPHSLKLGPVPCFITPPQGFLTEESGLDPLDPQWLPKR